MIMNQWREECHAAPKKSTKVHITRREKQVRTKSLE
jgi:hypothetical protein